MIGFFTGPFLYLAVTVFIVGAITKVVGLARLPRHLRWELYPLPGQSSKYEHVDFHRLRGHYNRWAEVIVMAEEILFLKKVFLSRRDLWVGSLLLHAGLYFGLFFLGLLTAGAAWSMAGASSPAFAFLTQATTWAGVVAVYSGLAGCVYLLVLRLINRGLRDLSDNLTFLNLILLGSLFAAGLWTWRADARFEQAREHLISLLRGNPASVQLPSLAIAIVLLGIFLIYLPFSRMFHAPAKYFFYHAILWDNEPIQSGSSIERDVTGYLSKQVTWSAAHIQQNKKWSEQQIKPEKAKHES